MRESIALVVATILTSGCTVDAPARCASPVGLSVEASNLPSAVISGDLTLHGTTKKRGVLVVHQLYIADVAATSVQGNFDTWVVTIPKARLLELRDDGVAALQVEANTSCPLDTELPALAPVRVVSGPPQLVPTSGTLAPAAPFRIEAQFESQATYSRCWANAPAGFDVVAGTDDLVDDNAVAMPDEDGILEIHITPPASPPAKSAVTIVCEDSLGQTAVGTYSLP